MCFLFILGLFVASADATKGITAGQDEINALKEGRAEVERPSC